MLADGEMAAMLDLAARVLAEVQTPLPAGARLELEPQAGGHERIPHGAEECGTRNA